jgi:hypothetical protein
MQASVANLRHPTAVEDLPAGLYEVLLSEALAHRLGDVDAPLVDRKALRSADAADRIAMHLARQITRALDAVPDGDRVAVGVSVARRLLAERPGEAASAEVLASLARHRIQTGWHEHAVPQAVSGDGPSMSTKRCVYLAAMREQRRVRRPYMAHPNRFQFG